MTIIYVLTTRSRQKRVTLSSNTIKGRTSSLNAIGPEVDAMVRKNARNILYWAFITAQFRRIQKDLSALVLGIWLIVITLLQKENYEAYLPFTAQKLEVFY